MRRAFILAAMVATWVAAAAQTPRQEPAQPPRQATAAGETEAPIFTVVEQNPEFPGGQEAFYQFLAANLKYPGNASQSVTGKVVVGFVVERDGTISNAKVVRDIAEGFGDEALRVVKLMPRWKPGRQNGKAVRVQMYLPIVFDIK